MTLTRSWSLQNRFRDLPPSRSRLVAVVCLCSTHMPNGTVNKLHLYGHVSHVRFSFNPTLRVVGTRERDNEPSPLVLAPPKRRPQSARRQARNPTSPVSWVEERLACATKTFFSRCPEKPTKTLEEPQESLPLSKV